MPQSRKNKDRKQKLNKYKTNHKMSSNNLANGMPPVRNVPTWKHTDNIVVTGYEWEAIQNSLAHLQLAQQAAQSVMSRNIVNGTIQMDFEKLNPQTLQYEPMTDAEKQPHREDFAKMLEAFKNPAVTQAIQPETPEANFTEDAPKQEPTVTLFNPSGEKIELPDQELPKQEGGAKVIQMTEFVQDFTKE